MIRQHVPLLLSSVLLLAAAGTASAGSETTDSSAFMRKAASDGKAEVQVCQLAMQRSNDPQLKQVAQRLMDDHMRTNAQLVALAKRKHVELPSTPEPEDEAKVKRLRSASGQGFDQAWIASNIKDHKTDIKTFGEASKQLEDQDTRQFAATALPALKTHLRLVEGLKDGSGSQSGAKGSGQGRP